MKSNSILAQCRTKSPQLIATLLFVVVFAAIAIAQIGLSLFIKGVFATAMVLVLPGMLMSYIFFPNSDAFQSDSADPQRTLDRIERLTISVLTSIVLTSIIIFIVARLLGNQRFNSENFYIALTLLIVFLFAGAAGRMKWLDWITVSILVLFPPSVILLHLWLRISMDKNIFSMELITLLLACILVRVFRTIRSKRNTSETGPLTQKGL